MASKRMSKFAHSIAVLSGLTFGVTNAVTSTPTTLITSSVSEFAPGVTPPPNQPLPPLDCPRPTQQYCYWEPDIVKDEYYTCWRSNINYVSSTNSLLNGAARRTITKHTLASTTDYSLSTTWDPAVSFSTLCDGHARAPPGATPDIITLTKVSPCTPSAVRCTSVEVTIVTSDLPWPASPTCKIPETECASLSHAYESMSTSFFGGWYSSQIPLGLWQKPPCTVDYTSYYPQTACETAAPPRVSCSIFPGGATMLYWPTKAAEDLCASHDETAVTGTRTAPGPQRTVVYEGKTLTSPTAYMILGSARIYQTVSVSGHTQKGFCGPSQPPVTLPIPPESVLKKVWRNGNQLQTVPFDFGDVNTISYEAYKDEVCGWGTLRQQVKDDCKTVWGQYSPTIVIPSQVTDAVQRGKGCDIVQQAQVEKWVPLGDVPAKETGI